MSFYDKLVEKWAELDSEMLSGSTTQQKLDALNALTVTSPPIPMVIPTYRIYNLLDAAEFVALTDENKGYIRDILSMGNVDTSPGTQARAVIVSIFGTSPLTIAALGTLAAEYDTPPAKPWHSVSWEQGGGGIGRPVTMNDLVAAGGLS